MAHLCRWLLLAVIAALSTSCGESPTSPSLFGVPLPGMAPTSRPEAHRTDFLNLPGLRSTLLLPGQTHLLEPALATLQTRNYTDVYLYVVNENDFGGPAFNWYSDPQGYRGLLETVTRAGIRPVVFLAPDDAPSFHTSSAFLLPMMWQTFIPAIDDLVGSYVLGLEMDEYWTREEQLRLATALPTSRPVFAHFSSGRRESISDYWPRMRAVGLLYQYQDPSRDGIRRETAEVAGKLAEVGKVVVAAEYGLGLSESEARSLGDLALNHGAIGYGNGGTK